MAQPIIGGASAARPPIPQTEGLDSIKPKAGPSRQTLATAGLGEIGIIAAALLKTINDEDRICDPIALAARGPLSRIEHLCDTVAECIGDGDDWSDEVLRARILDPQREGMARERRARELSDSSAATAAPTIAPKRKPEHDLAWNGASDEAISHRASFDFEHEGFRAHRLMRLVEWIERARNLLADIQHSALISTDLRTALQSQGVAFNDALWDAEESAGLSALHSEIAVAVRRMSEAGEQAGQDFPIAEVAHA